MLVDPHASPSGALAGLVVVDLSRILAGPYCTQMLADHGARVIKVEPPEGDGARAWGPPFLAEGCSAYYAALNRNKEHVQLDLTTRADRAALSRLIASADVVVENFKSDTMRRWGLGYEEHLASAYPRLIYTRITGYGIDGPTGGMPGYDAVVQAFAGLMSINGAPDGEPTRIGVPVVDLFTGTLAFAGTLLALHSRERTGVGQLVDLTLLDSALSLLHPHAAIWFADKGRVPTRHGTAHPTIAPYQTFRTRTGSVFVAAASDRQFTALTNALGRPDLNCNPRFRTNPLRVRNVDALRDALAPLFAVLQVSQAVELLDGVGVPCAPVHDVAEALQHPQVQHRQMVLRHDGYEGLGIPIKLSRTPGSVRSHPAPLGADTHAVLGEFASEPGTIRPDEKDEP